MRGLLTLGSITLLGCAATVTEPPTHDEEASQTDEEASRMRSPEWEVSVVSLADSEGAMGLQLPLHWRLPIAEHEPSLFGIGERPILALQRSGLYFDGEWIAAIEGDETSPQLATIELLYQRLAWLRRRAGSAFETESPSAWVLIDPALPSNFVLRALATSYRAGWQKLALLGADAETPDIASFQLGVLERPAPPLPTTIPHGLFEIVVDLGVEEVRIGILPAPGEFHGTNPVHWLEPEPVGPGSLDRLAQRLAVLDEQLRERGFAELRYVNISVVPERPFADLLTLADIAALPRCPADHRAGQSLSTCETAFVIVRAGPPPAIAIDEIMPDSEVEPEEEQSTFEDDGQTPPLDSVMAKAIYAPDPDMKALQATKAARFDKKNGTNVTAFCIDKYGNTMQIRTRVQFPDDPQVDAIMRETIAKWRFRPFLVDGEPIKTCTERTFKLKFR